VWKGTHADTFARLCVGFCHHCCYQSLGRERARTREGGREGERGERGVGKRIKITLTHERMHAQRGSGSLIHFSLSPLSLCVCVSE